MGLSRNIGYVRRVAHMEGMRRAHEILVRVPEEKRSLGTSGLSGLIKFEWIFKKLAILPEVFSRLPQFF